MRFARLVLFLLALSSPPLQADERGRKISFNREVRPLLSDACFHCHGPDKTRQKAGLHLDTEEGARVDLGGYFAIVPGKPGESTLLDRVAANDPGKRMPPPSAGPGLKPDQVALLREWIRQGAPFEKHWAFIPPRKAELPKVKTPGWARQSLDHFVLARLEKEGLKPSPEADRITLLRRVSLDLTGLPPTPAEVDAFLTDHSPQAYEAVVDRLLQSPRFGERLAKPWLDAARYADTNGYQTDGDRIMWRWRDWVIEAFNSNMPFDRFTIEQLAGDLLPNPTLDQRIATGFNRNHRGNSEGGVIPEEYAVEYVVDRVDTTSTVWLGLTLGCCRCHNHKYDPLTQTEFYQLFAYFNNVPERGKAIKYGNSPPMIQAPTREQQVHLKLLESQLRSAEMVWQHLQPDLDRAQKDWEKSFQITGPIDWTYSRGLLAHVPVDPKHRFQGQGGIVAGDVGGFGFFDQFTVAAWVQPDRADGSILSRMEATDRADGYHLYLEKGKLHLDLVKRWLDDAIRVETIETLKPGQRYHLAFSYDGTRLASGVKVWIDGREAKLKINLDDLNQSFFTKEPLRIGAGGTGRFHGKIHDVRIYDHVVLARDIGMLAQADPVSDLLARPAHLRTEFQNYKVRSYFLENHAPASLREARARLDRAIQELNAFQAQLPTCMVMEEMNPPRPTHVLLRGEYDKKGPRVEPGLPASLPPLPPGEPQNRLGFARWLVHPSHPLTARVAVNRFWQMLFGTGLVKTVEDFGSQGEWPSHPELLDWLAVDFMETGWDVQRLLKTLVTSAAYRQSSKAGPDHWHRDPENRLLARGPRVRLSAEMIRDQALFASGLLVEKIGGPSVKPYAPAGLVKELHGTDEQTQDHGPNLYRRSLYTYWKRTVAPPAMMTFDSANRETCVVRESRTNTPLQALNLMNDVTYLEAARVLAQRVMTEAKTPEERLKLAFRRATSRLPTSVELRILRSGLDQHLAFFQKNPQKAGRLVEQGEYPLERSLNVGELAAYTTLASLILNLDEVITKE